jgi:hypothetical protein
LDGRPIGSKTIARRGRNKFVLGPIGGGYGGLGVLELRSSRSVVPAAEGIQGTVRPLGLLLWDARFL